MIVGNVILHRLARDMDGGDLCLDQPGKSPPASTDVVTAAATAAGSTLAVAVCTAATTSSTSAGSIASSDEQGRVVHRSADRMMLHAFRLR